MNGGEKPGRIAQEGCCAGRAGVSAIRKLSQPSPARADDGELRHGKHAIDEDETEK